VTRARRQYDAVDPDRRLVAAELERVSCLVPEYVAKELLHAEGFSDVRYLKYPNETRKWVPEVLLAGYSQVWCMTESMRQLAR